jgi:uncharacterized protein YbjT (DUF2867 family)
MKVLVTGATGKVGAVVVEELLKRGVSVRVLVRESESPRKFPASVEIANGNMLDPVAVEAALHDIDRLFLLNAIVPDELNQALIAVVKAKKQGIKHIVYLSALRVDQFGDVAHLASKHAVEDALRTFGIPHTILRPGYFMQNELMFKEALDHGIYPAPIGGDGISVVDVRDIGEAAAIALTDEKHIGKIYELVAPILLSGASAAALWAEALGKTVQYGGEDLDAWEQGVRGMLPGWLAFDLRMMFEAFLERGFSATHAEAVRFRELLGREPRSYEAFVKETAKAWHDLRGERDAATSKDIKL